MVPKPFAPTFRHLVGPQVSIALVAPLTLPRILIRWNNNTLHRVVLMCRSRAHPALHIERPGHLGPRFEPPCRHSSTQTGYKTCKIALKSFSLKAEVEGGRAELMDSSLSPQRSKGKSQLKMKDRGRPKNESNPTTYQVLSVQGLPKAFSPGLMSWGRLLGLHSLKFNHNFYSLFLRL